jgi:hypothetical protein
MNGFIKVHHMAYFALHSLSVDFVVCTIRGLSLQGEPVRALRLYGFNSARAATCPSIRAIRTKVPPIQTVGSSTISLARAEIPLSC